jgi:hypothetical protein
MPRLWVVDSSGSRSGFPVSVSTASGPEGVVTVPVPTPLVSCDTVGLTKPFPQEPRSVTMSLGA